ncbi:MAG: ABC-type dipeptide transport system, periplasmic component [Acidimicrobiia bacterium]|nr:ABC-type dipeptide transport system, periplasmic component [Acidimicrobiia bacterium]
MARASATKALVALATGALAVAACGGGSSGTSADSQRTSTITIGASQEWGCADWINICAGSAYGAWAFLYQTMPRAMDVVSDGDGWKYAASPLLAGEPQVSNSPTQTVTYKINPKAVWSDGQPITSTDFKYTWDQIVNGTKIYDPSGYLQIASVDDSKPDTAVVTYKAPYAPWRAMFSNYGIFPSHLLQGKDRDAEMKAGYTWSGGPWKMDKWDQGHSFSLVPNDAYWGTKPKIGKVVVQFSQNTSAEFQSFKSKTLASISPAIDPDTTAQIAAGLSGVTKKVNAASGNIEALWLNNGSAPFNDVNVRKALAYSIDRDGLARRLFGVLGVTKAANSLVPASAAAYSDPEAWSEYTLDLGKVTQFMTAAGYAKGADGIWAKNGVRLTFTLNAFAGDKQRALEEEVLQSQLKTAGFDMKVSEGSPQDTFKLMGAGTFQALLLSASATGLDPAGSALFASTNIPSEANHFSGQNFWRVNVPGLDDQLKILDTSLDEKARQAAGKQADHLMADQQVSLPLIPAPTLGLYNSKIAGDFSFNVVYGPWWNMNTWTAK